MATKEHFTDNVVPLSTRQVIIERYDTNGDGVFDTDEIHCIIDDFISTTQVNKSLADTNSQLKKIIIGAFSLIVLLSISNFGTALLAMNMSKEVVVVDGKIVANGGSQEEAISTMTSVRTLKKEFPDTQHHQDRHRRILQGNIFSQGVQGNDTPPTEDDNEEVICFTSNEVNDLLESTIDGTGTNIVLVGTAAENGSGSRTIIPINGGVHGLEGDEGGYIFSNVQFVPVDSTERCTGETHRNLVHKGKPAHQRGKIAKVYEMETLPDKCSNADPTIAPISYPTTAAPITATPSYDASSCVIPDKEYSYYHSSVGEELGDGLCLNKEPWNTAECAWDGGDCEVFNKDYPDCDVENAYLINDLSCDNYALYNTKECGWDGGDCEVFNKDYPDCDGEKVYLINDNNCDNIAPYNTKECGWDGGDCEKFNKLYPDCDAVDVSYIDNKYCNNYAPYNTKECGYDGGDCA